MPRMFGVLATVGAGLNSILVGLGYMSSSAIWESIAWGVAAIYAFIITWDK